MVTIVSSSSVSVATHSLFINYYPKWNIQTSYFDINKPETIESFITLRNSFAESPTNPAISYDLELLGKIAKSTFDFNSRSVLQLLIYSNPKNGVSIQVHKANGWSRTSFG
jgi:hypothetical protein